MVLPALGQKERDEMRDPDYHICEKERERRRGKTVFGAYCENARERGEIYTRWRKAKKRLNLPAVAVCREGGGIRFVIARTPRLSRF